MHPDLDIQYNFSLKHLNSFGIDVRAHAYLRIASSAQLQQALLDPSLSALPRLLLGGGSNILLTKDFDGLVLHMVSSGIGIAATDLEVNYVRAAAGEQWHRFVLWTLAHGLGGLENLALIPGTVGAAPIQNIGAYGVEVKDYLHSVTVFDSANHQTIVMDQAACQLAYRDSIFKHADGRALVVLDVTFALPKNWQPQLRYAELAQALQGGAGLTPGAIADAVIAIRRRKLPDPASIGNAGSFFKNPLVSKKQCSMLLEKFPALVHHVQGDGSEKLAAGWLIDQCGWKGRNLGPAGVYAQQALVLVNNGGATGFDIVKLARAIQADVLERYGVALEPEPVFV